MFERICISPKSPGKTTYDLGLLAEALLFYRDVILIARPNSPKTILREIGPDVLIGLMDDRRIRVVYVEQLFGTFTLDANSPCERYDFGLATSEKTKLDRAAEEAFINVIGKRGKGKRLANHFARSVEPMSFDNQITKQITDEIRDGRYVSEYIRRWILEQQIQIDPNLLDNVVFKFGPLVNRGFSVVTNLDMTALKSAGVRKLDSVSGILTTYGTSVAELSLWSRLEAEAALDIDEAVVLQSRLDGMLKKRAETEKEVASFQDFIFDEARALREAINSGMCGFGEIIPLLDKAKRFSEWLTGKSLEQGIVKAYYREVTADSWIDKLPGKTSRWAFFTGTGLILDMAGAGGIGTGVGVALSALDSFLLDRMIKGWKPNQFIEGDLAEFIKKRRPNST
jgi:hypothetical protein